MCKKKKKVLVWYDIRLILTLTVNDRFDSYKKKLCI